MTTEPKEMRELHELRARLTQEQKGWTPKQVIDYYRRAADEVAKELGIQLKRQPHRQAQRKAG